jgi:YVTN family beta-propeller protein
MTSIRSLLASLIFLAATSASAERLIVVNKTDNTVSILDPATGRALATVPVGSGPHEAEVLPGGKLVAVSDYGKQGAPGHTLSLVDLDKGDRASVIELGEGARPHGMDALSDGRLLVSAEGKKELLVVDPKAGKVVARIPTGKEVSHMVVASPDGKRAFVANIGSGSVTAIDLVARKVLRHIETGKGAEGIDITPDGREVWVTNREADTVSVLDAGTLEVSATLPAAQFPIRVKITPDGKRALVSCARSGNVAVFDVAARKETRRVSIDKEAVPGSTDRIFSDQFGKSPVPVGLAIALDGKRAWVASTNADIVSEIDLGSWSVVRRLTAGKEPDGLALASP